MYYHFTVVLNQFYPFSMDNPLIETINNTPQPNPQGGKKINLNDEEHYFTALYTQKKIMINTEYKISCMPPSNWRSKEKCWIQAAAAP